MEVVMQKVIKRDEYLGRMIDKKENGLIKVITGISRCGKSFLLFNLFYDYLIDSGVKEEQIITIALNDDLFVDYRDPDELSKYIRGKIVNKDMYYILIDEVQYAISKDDELNFITGVARKEGVILDPVYTGKAFYGLYNEIQKGTFDDHENILFIHTGGLYGLFPKQEQIAKLIS